MNTCVCGNPANDNGTTCRRCDALHELGLKAGATDAEVKSAHRLYVKAWHPDRFPGDEKSKNVAQEKLKSINSAYEFLTSPSSKNGQPYRPKAASQPAQSQESSQQNKSSAKQPPPDGGRSQEYHPRPNTVRGLQRPSRHVLASIFIGCLVLLVIAILNINTNRHAQQNDVPKGDILPSEQLTSDRPSSTSTTAVPYVGCKSDGQGGPVEAPNGTSKLVSIDTEKALQLAYYESENGFGVLAPRGWYCHGTYGSDGDTLYVSPQPINTANLFSSEGAGFTGPAIQLTRVSGDTSGRFSVAKTIARVFPAHRAFARKVIEEGTEPASSFPFFPYPKDKLSYRSDEIVEYVTPAHADGLGTSSHLISNSDPISGVAILFGQDTDLFQLSVRLSQRNKELTSAIISQVERDVEDRTHRESSNASTTNVSGDTEHPSAKVKVGMGYPVPEKTFVDAYVLANAGREDLSEEQLVQLAHDEYTMGRQIDTETLLMGGDLFNLRGKRAMDYLYKLKQQQRQTQ